MEVGMNSERVKEALSGIKKSYNEIADAFNEAVSTLKEVSIESNAGVMYDLSELIQRSAKDVVAMRDEIVPAIKKTEDLIEELENQFNKRTV